MEKEPLNHSGQQDSNTPEPDATEAETPETDNPAKDQEKAQEEKPKKGFFGGSSKTKKLQEEIESLKAEVAELKDKNLRLLAEFENYRRRTRQEIDDLLKHASAGLMKDLLPVLDDMDRAQATLEAGGSLQAMREGFDLIMGKLRKTLEQRGLQAMIVKDAPFDPEQHEAIANVPVLDKDKHGKVVEEIEKGYLMNGKIIRYARVVVANHSDEQA